MVQQQRSVSEIKRQALTPHTTNKEILSDYMKSVYKLI